MVCLGGDSSQSLGLEADIEVEGHKRVLRGRDSDRTWEAKDKAWGKEVQVFGDRAKNDGIESEMRTEA